MIAIIISVIILLANIFALAFDLKNALSSALHPLAYRLSRLSVWLPTGITYAFFYATRYNIAAGNTPAVQEQLGLASADFATTLTAGFWTYAFTAPFTGIVSDKIGGRKALLLSSISCGVCNMLLGLTFTANSPIPHASQYYAFVLFYCTNIFFQGFGTCAVVKLNANWYTPLERGLFCGLYNILLTTGYYFALGGCPVIIQELGWEYCFWLPGGCLFLCFGGMLCFLQEAPTKEQLVRNEDNLTESTKLLGQKKSETNLAALSAPIEASDETSITDSTESANGAKKSPKKVKFADLLRNPTFVCYLLAIMNLCWVRDGLVTWVYAFLEDSRGYATSTDMAAMVGGGITLGGFVGGVMCGLVSDYVFDSRRAPPILLFSALQAVALTMLYVAATSGWSDEIVAALVFVLAIFMLGNYTLLSYTVPTDLPGEIVATAAGVMTAAGYLASGCAGVFMGKLIDRYGFFGWVCSLQLATFLSAAAIWVGSMYTLGAEEEEEEELRESLMGGEEAEGNRAPLYRSGSTGHDIEGGARLRKHTVSKKSSAKLDVLTMLMIGGEPQIVPVRESRKKIMRISGVQDEFLRRQWGTEEFVLWDAKGSAGSRMAWRLATITGTPGRRSKTFLKHRAKDPTSYFGQIEVKRQAGGQAHSVLPW